MSGGGHQWALRGATSSGEKLATRGSTRYALDRRHEDGEHWIELGIFPSRFLAQEALERHVGDGDDDASSYRLRKV